MANWIWRQVADVLKHPFFRSVPPRSPPILAPTFVHLASTVPRGFGEVSIDGDIMKNMRTLWRNRQDKDIIRAIRNQQYVSSVALVSHSMIANNIIQRQLGKDCVLSPVRVQDETAKVHRVVH